MSSKEAWFGPFGRHMLQAHLGCQRFEIRASVLALRRPSLPTSTFRAEDVPAQYERMRFCHATAFIDAYFWLFSLGSFQAFIPIYEKLNEAYKEWDGDEDMITPSQASLMVVDWTDPQKAR